MQPGAGHRSGGTLSQIQAATGFASSQTSVSPMNGRGEVAPLMSLQGWNVESPLTMSIIGRQKPVASSILELTEASVLSTWKHHLKQHGEVDPKGGRGLRWQNEIHCHCSA